MCRPKIHLFVINSELKPRFARDSTRRVSSLQDSVPAQANRCAGDLTIHSRQNLRINDTHLTPW